MELIASNYVSVNAKYRYVQIFQVVFMYLEVISPYLYQDVFWTLILKENIKSWSNKALEYKNLKIIV